MKYYGKFRRISPSPNKQMLCKEKAPERIERDRKRERGRERERQGKIRRERERGESEGRERERKRDKHTKINVFL